MIEIRKIAARAEGLTDGEIDEAVRQSIAAIDRPLKKVLLIPPDITRIHSGAGGITAKYYKLLKDSCIVDILPAVGTMTG